MNEKIFKDDKNNGGVLTYFAPPERVSKETIEKQSDFVLNNTILQAIIESIDGYLMILNEQRQVLAMNKELMKDLKIENPSCLFGNRPGEVLGCIHSAEGPNGCGTSKTCSTCGAVISILASQKDESSSINECLATVKHGTANDSLEFRVRATTIKVDEQKFTILVLNDISGEKRKAILERVFFHDILNTIGGLLGWSNLLRDLDEINPKDIASHIVSLSKRLQQEIEDQRRLSKAEQGELELTFQTVQIKDIFSILKTVFENHSVSHGKNFDILNADSEEKIFTDDSLLIRILTNMIKNAFEATNYGETVRLWYEIQNEEITFFVSNPSYIPEHIALQIFKRSFSTKAKTGRGIGTYSMKLFGERYLNGKVGFETSEEKGTTFYIKIPIKFSQTLKT